MRTARIAFAAAVALGATVLLLMLTSVDQRWYYAPAALIAAMIKMLGF